MVIFLSDILELLHVNILKIIWIQISYFGLDNGYLDKQVKSIFIEKLIDFDTSLNVQNVLENKYNYYK